MSHTEEELRVARRRLAVIFGGFIFLMLGVACPPLLITVPVTYYLYLQRKRNQRKRQAELRQQSQINRRGY